MRSFHGGNHRTIARFGMAFALSATLLTSVFLQGTVQAAAPVQSVNAYNQNFDASLTQTGAAPWQNDTTVQGWYAAAGSTDITTYNAFTATSGTSFAGGLYSFGSGNNRALGTIGSSTGNPKRFGVILQNKTGATIKDIYVSYKGEQWLDANATLTSTLQFKYKTGTNLGAADLKSSTGYNSAGHVLDFVSPQTSAQGLIDGTLTQNSRTLTATINIPDVAPNGNILLAWENDNIGGDDHGLAVDDLVVTATLAGNAPIQSTCATPLNTTQGTAGSETISAYDADGIVSSANITVSPPNNGITLINQTAAITNGDTYTATLNVSNSVPAGTYNVTATFTSQGAAAQTGTCTLQVVVAPPPPTPNFATSGITVNPTSVNVGDVFTYTVSITNSGGITGTYTLNDTLPNSVKIVSVSPGLTQTGQSVKTTNKIAAQSVVSYTIGVQGLVAGTVSNSATVSGDGTTHALIAPPVTVRVQSTPANFSGSSKTVDKATAAANDRLVYTINISNSGQLEGTFNVTDTLDPNVTLVVTPAGMTLNGNVLTASDKLKGGETRSYVIIVQINSNVASNTSITNNAILTGDGRTKTMSATTAVGLVVRSTTYLPMIMR